MSEQEQHPTPEQQEPVTPPQQPPAIEVTLKRKKWSERSKRSKIGLILSVLILLLSIAGLFIFAFSRQIFGDAIGNKLLGEGVANGFVYIWNGVKNKAVAIIGTFVTIVLSFIIYFILNFIIRLVTGPTSKAQTIASLIKSCVKYVTIIVAIAIILTLWGVNVVSVVAGLGILTLIVGLGCQTLIQDVISGIFIVFDDYFSVGDTVIVDGFRGKVTSIGLKTTKITDASGNIKSITNSSISTVTNVSRLPTMVTITMDIDYAESVERVEGIIGENLEAVSKGIPQITEGIYYKGVDGFNAAGVSLLFLAFCQEGDRFQVARDMKRDIYLLFKRNNVQIPFNQITINQPSPVVPAPAAPEQIEVSKKLIKKNRTVNKPKLVRKTLRQKAAEAFDEEIGEIKK